MVNLVNMLKLWENTHFNGYKQEYLGTYIWYKENTNVGEYVLDNM